MKKDRYILIAIFAIGVFVRVIGLTNHPVGFTPDEASFGYDAYSLIHTGRDQWGTSWPLVLKSFGDYKMPLYSYLTIPSILIFGLSEMAVRLPNAILGSLAIVVTFALARHVFDKKIAFFSALLLALSPWHIPLSRGAFEANLTTFFLPLGIYLFLKGQKKPLFIFLSAIVFGLNLFTYHSARIVTPFVVFALIAGNTKVINKNITSYIPGAIIFLIFSLAGILTLFQGSAVRATTSSLFSASGAILHERVDAVNVGEPVLLSKLFNNKATYLIDKLSGNYFSYFSPEFLFVNGPREGTYGMVPGTGVLYFFEIFSLFIVFIYIVTKKLKVPLWLCVWILLAPLPASLSIGPGLAANRAAIMMPSIQIFSGIGMYYVYDFFKRKYKNYALISASLIMLVSFGMFLENYWYWQPAKEAKAMIYGGKEVIQNVEEISKQYSNVVITKGLSEPHIFAAFYTKLDPNTFQMESTKWNFEERGLNWVDQLPAYELGNYTFKNIDWSADMSDPNTLIVASDEVLPPGINVVNTINYPNGTPAYVIVDNKLTNFALE